MAENRVMLNNDQLDSVVGGLFVFHKDSKYLTFTHPNGEVTNHNVLDYQKAWDTICQLEVQNMDKDEIFAQLVSKGYIDPSLRA